ncbi:type VI secretion system tip protein VgrG [Pseudoxanthomonas kalamensis DSM 18571]|uniref:type VI secretion system Vgr family protein n=1 Tax=Pseudoxanthomonas kalamensis TaxID=289483 RepID=UPI001391C0C4|nr:type VI secretion system Vgr family protein [Pseudoxanthomonas kalamensis]KAF1712641.1 type VI secretion system tip protein VgrG [Pseudoxanthomonas kalamensis DSM 18571]
MEDAIATLATLLAAGPRQSGRLLRLHTPLGPDVLVAETLDGVESLDAGGYCLELTALSLDAQLDLAALPGRAVLLELLQADGSLRPFHGHVTAFEHEGSNGGLARYRLRIEPWLALLRQRVDSHVFQDKSVVEIVEDVFADYAEAGELVPAWRWELTDRSVYRRRSLTTQYGESDFNFVARLLADEGIGYCIEHAGDASAEHLGAHTLVLFDGNDALSELGAVRFHRSDASERTDSVTRWQLTTRAQTGSLSRASWDYRSLSLRPASAEGKAHGGITANDEDTAGPYAWHDRDEGERLVARQLEALQVQARVAAGRGSWRALQAGARFTLVEHGQGDGDWLCLQVRHWARNNLGAEVAERSEALLGAVTLARPALPAALAGLGSDPHPRDAGELPHDDARPDVAGDNLQLGEGFYSNRFSAIPASTPYRPKLEDDHGLRRHPKPSVAGTLTGIVVGEGPVHTDRDHRIRVQLPSVRPRGEGMQADAAAAADEGQFETWVRVATPWAGDNWGGVFVPRIGQEVLVGFLEGDIDRPVIVGALYNGQGNADAPHNQVGGGLAGATGNAPAWFEGNDHKAVFTGFKSQALGASQDGSGGYQQLRLDDTPGQGRAQLSTTQQASTLTLGHLKGGQDNVRGAERGYGIELNTQAFGALRSGQGLLLSTEAGRRQLDAQQAQQQLAQGEQLLQTLADTAKTQTAVLEGDPDTLPAQESLKALQETLAATQSGSAPGNGIEGGDGEAPGWSAPVLLGSGVDGVLALTPADQHWVSGTQTLLDAGRDLNWLSQGETVIASGGGTLLFTHGGPPPQGKPNQETGIALHAAQGKVSARAHKNLARVAAQDSIRVASTQAEVEVSSPSKHVLLTAAGAYIKLEGGNIELGAPGTIEFKASQKELTGPKSASGQAQIPQGELKACPKQDAAAAAGGAAML